MLHYGRNPSIKVPVDVALYDGLVPLNGESPNLSGQVLCLDNGYRLDIDGNFKTNPVSPYLQFDPYSAFSNVYYTILDPSGWPRGHYRCFVNHTSGLTFAYDFTVGLYVDRKLAYSVVYTGTQLNMNLWVEDNGEPQSDFTALKDVAIKLLDGTVLKTLGDLTASAGVFTIQESIVLPANKNFVMEAKAFVPGPATKPDYQFTLRVGLARP